MRALVQRVISASVQVEGTVIGSLDLSVGQQGLVVLVGVTHTDTLEHSIALADKVWNMRILDDEKSASDVGAPLLVISQFTLYANTAKGRRPSWNQAAPGSAAEPLVDGVVDRLRILGATVDTGRFGAHMHLALVGDGPVTVSLEL
ncbi:D-aminoacyl-tRNA deacylase [Rhodococcoides yunnanense]|uniref:D-aminoacyl-tRNA deacylase n=1 Tax=Rhodococcoides yunnanense TaxID=278209 RepID=UPI0009325E21|nr:D-aminoacyl-tRNA deacylase [Rhodococcus yunnanensis]